MARRSRGQALVELALVAPVALLLIGGAVDFGRLFYAQITIADAAREGALWAAQHPNSWIQGCDASQPIGASNEDQVTCHARNEANGGLVSIAAGHVACSSTPAPTSTVCAQDAPAPGDAVYVTVTGQFKTIMGGITFSLGDTAAGRIVQMPAQTAATVAQSISFGALADQDVGVGSIAVSATATSGLTVTFSTTTPSVCSSSGANGSVISVFAVGTCTVVADQAGDGHWSPAPSVSEWFQVTEQPPPGPGGQVITFGPLADRQLGSGSPLVGATASSGLPVSFTTTTQTVCSSGGAGGSTITLLQAGLCTVKADQPGNATYAAAPSVLQSFNVTPSPPTCPPPALTFTITPNVGTAFRNNGHPGTLFAYDATGSTIDASCHAVWSWNFGNAAGTSSTPVHTTYTYPSAAPAPGLFTVTLTVTVDGGASGTTTQTVRVNPG